MLDFPGFLQMLQGRVRTADAGRQCELQRCCSPINMISIIYTCLVCSLRVGLAIERGAAAGGCNPGSRRNDTLLLQSHCIARMDMKYGFEP
jgi:hypothetical protein